MASRQHLSLFSYSIVRPYPFKWFTPVTGVVFVLLTVLFSFLNFVSTGFNLVTQNSPNPNATVAKDVWLRHWPSYISHNVQPTCQAVNLPVGSAQPEEETTIGLYDTSSSCCKRHSYATWRLNGVPVIRAAERSVSSSRAQWAPVFAQLERLSLKVHNLPWKQRDSRAVRDLLVQCAALEELSLAECRLGGMEEVCKF